VSGTVRDALRAATARLSGAGIDGAARDARVLMAAALAIEPDRLMLIDTDALPQAARERFEAFVESRLHRMPVARIVGERLFWGRPFRVTPDVLDPRPETEVLIAAALDGGPARTVLDLGTGSGIIAVTLLCEMPGAVALGTDISAPALAVARANAARHDVGDRFETLQADWYRGVEGAFDLIVSNPPYIAAAEMPGLAPEVRGHDPGIALTDGADGLTAYRAIAAGLPAHLNPGGRVLLETGPAQGAAVADLLAGAGLRQIAVLPDLDGRDRVVSARMPR